MAVAVETVALEKFNVAVGVEVAVAIPVFLASEVVVTYGREGLATVQNTDYTVELLDESAFDTFTITPLAPLLTKINALIAADGTEINSVVVRRVLPFTTSSTPALVAYTQFISNQFDRAYALLQQMKGSVGRTLQASLGFTGELPILVPPFTASTALVVSADGESIESGPTVTQISNAQAYAEAASDSADDSEGFSGAAGTSAASALQAYNDVLAAIADRQVSLNVLAYGATSGNFDSLVAFDAAHAAVSAAGGGYIDVPEGDWQLSDTFIIGAASKFIGLRLASGARVRPFSALTDLIKIAYGNTKIEGAGYIHNASALGVNAVVIDKAWDNSTVEITGQYFASWTKAVRHVNGDRLLIDKNTFNSNTVAVSIEENGMNSNITNNYILGGVGITFSYTTQQAEGVLISGNKVLPAVANASAIVVQGGLLFDINDNILDQVLGTGKAIDLNGAGGHPVAHVMMRGGWLCGGPSAGGSCIKAHGTVSHIGVNGPTLVGTTSTRALDWDSVAKGSIYGAVVKPGLSGPSFYFNDCIELVIALNEGVGEGTGARENSGCSNFWFGNDAVPNPGSRSINSTYQMHGDTSQKILSAGARGVAGYYPGRYHVGEGWNAGITNTAAYSQDVIHAMRFEVGREVTWTKIGIEVTVAGAAGKLARLGIYRAGLNGAPGALVLDAGTVAVDSLGIKEITISQTLPMGVYYLAYVSNGGPTIRGLPNNTNVPGGVRGIGVALPGNGSDQQVFIAHVFAALPNPFGACGFSVGGPPMIWMRC